MAQDPYCSGWALTCSLTSNRRISISPSNLVSSRKIVCNFHAAKARAGIQLPDGKCTMVIGYRLVFTADLLAV